MSQQTDQIIERSAQSANAPSRQDVEVSPGGLRSRDIDLYLHQQALDTSTPSGRALFGMLGVFSR
jgi:hypothetical protein